MPLWLVDFLTKVVWVVLKAVYPIILQAILKPMTPEDKEKWDEVVRKGGTKEDIMDFHKNRGKVQSSTVIIKENKPKVKTADHKREK